MKKEDERRQRETEEEELERGAEEKEKAIAQFEKTMIGLEGGDKKNGKSNSSEESARKEGKGVKRKFELDEDEMLKNAKEERAKARKVLDEEKVRHIRPMPYNNVHSQLTVYSRLKQYCPPSGCPRSRRPRITHKQAKLQNYRPSALPLPPTTNTLYRSNP